MYEIPGSRLHELRESEVALRRVRELCALRQAQGHDSVRLDDVLAVLTDDTDPPTREHEHVWAYRSSFGDPYRTCRRCGRVEDVDQ